LFDRGENGISLLGITGYDIIEVDGKYVMVEMLLSAVPFGDVKHTGNSADKPPSESVVRAPPGTIWIKVPPHGPHQSSMDS
jgi:hypothetical protein